MSHTYTPVAADAPESDGNRGADTEDKGAPRPTSTKNWLSARSCLIGSLVACTITGMSVLTARPWSDNASRAQVLGCGNSSAEASAAGCRFDIMSFAWSQPPCFDEELMDDFLGRGDWAWWLDPRGKRPVLWADAAEGRHSELYVTWEYHLLHCTYMWRKMHRALLNGNPVDSYIADYHHTDHCEMMLLDRKQAMDARNTIIQVKYPTCPTG